MLSMLFSPIRIGHMELKNRIVMPAMHFLPAWEGDVLPHHIHYFEERARGGAALIIIGGCTINESSGGANMISVRDDRFIPGLRTLAHAVQAHGCKIGGQLFHGGRYVHSALIGGQKSLSSSPIRSALTGETPRELSIAEIREIQRDFATATGRLKQAGFDAVEVIASAGYLINQFLSPVVNHRQDEYGGDLAKRMRFALEVAREIRQEVGGDFPVSFRIGGNDFMPGGLENKEAQVFSRKLEQAGVSMINVTGGWHETRVPQIPMAVPRGGFVYLAQGIKEAVSIPVMACNRINDPLLAEQVLQNGQADLIGFARGLIADPELPNKARMGLCDEINYCIACNQGCFDPIFEAKPVTCLVNARAGAEGKRTLEPARSKKKVMVIGGGPAGMEAARVAALRGHRVVLYEKAEKMGGQLSLAAVPPGRGEFRTFVRYLEYQIKKLDVTVVPHTEATLQHVEMEKPDVLVVATGARPALPEIEGVNLPNVITAWDVLAGKTQVGREVVVVGGGAVGLETALFLARIGTLEPEVLHFLMFYQAETPAMIESLLYRGLKKVTVLEMLKKMGEDMGASTRWVILQDLSRLGVDTLNQAVVQEIHEGGVVVERKGKRMMIPADTIVLATGTRPVNDIYAPARNIVPQVFLIGDAKQPRKALEAVAEGMEVGRTI